MYVRDFSDVPECLMRRPTMSSSTPTIRRCVENDFLIEYIESVRPRRSSFASPAAAMSLSIVR